MPPPETRAAAAGWCAVALLAGLASCSTRPRAPALENAPVYHNAREGFRFLVPEGWTQQSRAEFPPGPAEKERLLVAYRFAGSSVALFEVTLIDLAESADLAAYLGRPSFGASDWKPASPPADVACGGRTGRRLVFASGHLNREVVAVRRGERVYLFTGLVAAEDGRARQELRRAVASILWDR